MIVISNTNLKGGVGKTTASVSIANFLAMKGFKTLLIDADPQGNASSYLGVKEQACEDEATLYDALDGSLSFEDCIYEATSKKGAIENLWCIAADRTLDGAHAKYVGKVSSRKLPSKKLDPLSDMFDYVIIDCAPSTGVILENALTASDFFMVSTFPEADSFDGLGDLYEVIAELKDSFNLPLSYLGCIVTRHKKGEAHNDFLKSIEKELKGDKIPLLGVIPDSQLIPAASAKGIPLPEYRPSSAPAKKYREATEKIIKLVNSYLKVKPKKKKSSAKKANTSISTVSMDVGGIDL